MFFGIEFFLLHHLECREQFTAREIGPRAVIGESRESLEDVEATCVVAVVGLIAPDRNQNFARHADIWLRSTGQDAGIARPACAGRPTRAAAKRRCRDMSRPA